jgi:hypothetical protein
MDEVKFLAIILEVKCTLSSSLFGGNAKKKKDR